MIIMQSVGGVYPLPRHVLGEQYFDHATRGDNHTAGATTEGISRLNAQFLALRAACQQGVPQTVYRSRDTANWTHKSAADVVLDQVEPYVTILPSRFFQ